MVDNVQESIKSLIAERNGVNIAEFISLANHLTAKAYYKNALTIGTQGDFVTSSEISQIFGEIIAIWILDIWQNKFCKSKIQILELGPGSGNLMADILRVTKNLADFHANIEIYLLDINESLIKQQTQKLVNFIPSIKWVTSIEEIPSNPTIIIANEFFDVFGVRQFIKKKYKWYEICVQINSENDLQQEEKECFDLDIIKELDLHINIEEGGIIELNIDSTAFLQLLLKRFTNVAGAIIDYGYCISPNLRTKNQYNATIQALKDHKYVDVYKNFAVADITTHVDFYALQKLILSRNLKSYYYTQKTFLKNYGIDIRLNMLKNLNPLCAKALDKEVEYLTSDKYMGDMFKVLTFCKE